MKMCKCLVRYYPFVSYYEYTKSRISRNLTFFGFSASFKQIDWYSFNSIGYSISKLGKIK